MKMFTLVAVVSCLSILAVQQRSVFAEARDVLDVGDVMDAFTLENQHGELCTLDKGTERLIVSFDMKLSKSFHKWLKEKGNTWLTDNKAEYVIDITGMPRIVTYLFAGPKMRKYGFQILLITDDEFGNTFPVREGTFTIVRLDANHNVTDITFAASIEEIVAGVE